MRITIYRAYFTTHSELGKTQAVFYRAKFREYGLRAKFRLECPELLIES